VFPELRRARRATLWAPLALLAVVTACDSSGSGDSDFGQHGGRERPRPHGGTPAVGGNGGGPAGGEPGTGGAGGGVAPGARFEATRANLRFKGAARIREDFARVLQLPADALCKRARSSTTASTEIHQIALGGVEPYKANIFVPFPGVAVGAPLAVERRGPVRPAASACGVIWRRRRSGVYLRPPARRCRGALVDVDAPEIDAALTRLFREALLREPSREDLDVVKGLYADVVAEGGPEPRADVGDSSLARPC
jgi:hypothetical protein